MSWREEIRDASFRGVKFTADDASGVNGRRGTDHEFPGRDEPYAEDAGRRQRRYPVGGHIAGNDYLVELKKMRAASEKEGAGELIHPYFGRMMVVCRSMSWEVSSEHGGLANLAFDFVEAGALANPAETAATSDEVAAAALAMIDAAEDDYSLLDDVSRSTYEAATWTENVSDKVALISEKVTGPFFYTVDNLTAIAVALAEIDEEASTLAATPSVIAARTKAALDIIASLSVVKAFTGDSGQDAEELSGQPTPTEDNVQRDLEANRALNQRMMLGRQADLLRLEDFTSYDQAIAERDRFTDLIDAEFLAGPTDDIFTALVDLRAAVQADIDARAQDLPRIVSLTLVQSRTTLDIAQELYGDATRAAEIETRNNIAHPAFVSGTIQVLSK